MRFDGRYDVVAQLDYPLGESSDPAYDTWGRAISDEVHALFDAASAIEGVRIVRTANHLDISLRVTSFAALRPAMSLLLATVMPQASEDVVFKIHEAAVEPGGCEERMNETRI